MSSSMLHIKPEEVDSIEKRGKYTVAVIGCKEYGILHACLFAETGFKVMCVDTDQTVVNSIARGKTPFLRREIEFKLKTHMKMGRLNATNDIRTAVSKSDIIALTIPVKIDEKTKANYSEIENTCKQVGISLHRGSLVIVTSATGLGVMQGLIKETLENTSGFKVGADFALAYSPVRGLGEASLETLLDHERIVAAADKTSLIAASTILETIARKGVKRTENLRTAEAATLFEAIQQDVSVALANELAVLCEKLGVDYLEAYELAKIGGYSGLSLPTLVNGSVQEEQHLLLEDAENLNLKLRIPTTAREISEEIIRHAINLTMDALRNCGKTMRRARISLFGVSQTQSLRVSAQKNAKQLVKMLEARGAKVRVYDPYFSGDELAEIQGPFKNLTEAVEGADCILILKGYDQFKRLNLKKLKVMMKKPAAIVDLEGMVEPDKVEKEGFIYRGLGRGVWTK